MRPDPPPIIERSLGLYKTLWLEKYRKCGREYAILQCDTCGRYQAVPIRCDIRLCEGCSARRGKRIEKKYLPLIKVSSRLEKLSFLTLTIRNIWNLEVGFLKIKKAIRRFRWTKYVKKRLKAGLYAYEVTIDENGWYHIHAHFIIKHRWFGSPTRKEIRNLFLPERLKSTKGISSKDDLVQRKGIDTGQIVLSSIWENLTSDPVIDIRTVRSPKKALRYLVKYILKPPSFPCTENYVDYLKCFENKPLVVSFGNLRGGSVGVEGGLICPCGSGIFFFVCIADKSEVKEWLREDGWDPPNWIVLHG